MKRIFSLMISGAMLLSLSTVSLAVYDGDNSAADALHNLGLFAGSGVDADGKPIYDLDHVPTRNEAITMMVGLLGKSEEARNGSWDMPFTDVPDWAKPYVGYAYANGLTSGVSSTAFGGNDPVTSAQYLTFALKSLGYDSTTDFKWDRAWEFTDQLGLTSGEYTDSTDPFLRGDMAQVSFDSLSAPQKDNQEPLAQKLIQEGVFTVDQYSAVSDTPISQPPQSTFDIESYLLSLEPDEIEYGADIGNEWDMFYFEDRFLLESISETIRSETTYTFTNETLADVTSQIPFVGTRVEVFPEQRRVDIEHFYGKGTTIERHRLYEEGYAPPLNPVIPPSSEYPINEEMDAFLRALGPSEIVYSRGAPFDDYYFEDEYMLPDLSEEFCAEFDLHLMEERSHTGNYYSVSYISFLGTRISVMEDGRVHIDEFYGEGELIGSVELFPD